MSDELKDLDFTNKETLETLIEQTYKVENEYKALQKVLKEMLEVLPNALWVLDNKKNIILQNHLAAANAELLGQIDLKKPNDELEFKGRFFVAKVLADNEKFIIQATDISDQKRNERLASMGAVAAHLAHEIRNPIGSVSLLASTLYARTELKNKHIVLEMQKAISRVERIINSTLLFTKGVHINRICFDLSELKDECEQVCAAYNFSSDIKFDFSFPQMQINADKSLLSLVLQNLIYNGIDAIEESERGSGTLCVKASAANGEICVRVYDDGVEIADEKAVFEAFKTTKLKGNGLGLSLSKQIIEAHGGKMGFEKKPKCFYFVLGM